jgi:hypothetical protein
MHEVQRCPRFGRYQEKSGRRPDIAVSGAFDQGGRIGGELAMLVKSLCIRGVRSTNPAT